MLRIKFEYKTNLKNLLKNDTFLQLANFIKILERKKKLKAEFDNKMWIKETIKLLVALSNQNAPTNSALTFCKILLETYPNIETRITLNNTIVFINYLEMWIDYTNLPQYFKILSQILKMCKSNLLKNVSI